jgi:hypothetical protein
MRNAMFGIAAILAIVAAPACGGTQANGPFPALPRRSDSARVTPNGSWILPEARGRNLLYVGDEYDSITDIYAYPEGTLVGALSTYGEFQHGLCSSANGNVFIAAGSGIYEYPHARPRAIAILGDPQGTALGCSSDPVTGDLAAISDGGVAIFRPARRDRWHLPTVIESSTYLEIYCGTYDGSGNLFLGGEEYSTAKPASSGRAVFLEIRKGTTKFAPVTLNQKISQAGAMAWDGSYLDIGEGKVSNLLIHRFALHGVRGTQVGTIQLRGVNSLAQFAIQQKTLIGSGYETQHLFGFWRYPRGGSPIEVVPQASAYGIAISVAPHS